MVFKVEVSQSNHVAGESEAMWKKWYQAQGYDTTNWSAPLIIFMTMIMMIGVK